MSVAERLFADLQQDFGLQPHQAAAIVGNLAHESGGFRQMQEVNPLIPGSRGGFGYAQWTGPRRIAFEDWSNRQGMDPTSYDANYGFLKHELTATPEGRVLEQLKQAPDPATATQVFMQGYLRPGIPGLDSRLKWTSRVLGGEPIGTPSVGGLKIGAMPPAIPGGAPANDEEDARSFEALRAQMAALIPKQQQQGAPIMQRKPAPAFDAAALRSLLKRR